MKKTLLIVLLLIISGGIQDTFAQIWAGTHSSTYGELRLIEESWPNGQGIVYGDYRDNGTIVGEIGNGGRELTGDFFNGSWTGKFFFDRQFVNTGSRSSNNFSFQGFWGQTTNNRNSTNPNDKWDGNRINVQTTGRIRVAVWSGRWDTNFGPIFLHQIGNEITGIYGNTNRIEGTYDPRDRKLKGKFNQGGRVGSFEFTITGNDFTGIWGWGAMLNEGAWTGTKTTKSNAPMPALTISNPNLIGRYRVRVESLSIAIMTGVFFPNRDIAGEFNVRMMGKTNPSASFTEIRPRDGRSTRVWSATSNNPLRINQESPVKTANIRGPNNQILERLSYAGRHVIDRVLEFDVNAQMANNDLEIQVNSKITSVGSVSDQVLPDASLRIKLSELEPGRTYYIMNSQQSSNFQQAFITFTIQKL
ncbi:hypothetical protein [Mongoliitalea lutea]|uniref:Uncharacterized protein n=1 Tax=Mongoliitalea lutea TaxID=849756 RepID=A0A8J3CTS8_9BACT|nr:hypothetical protein [Mongoliitalea lutea]GHB26253.1 hypothetical protein GCM10008106_03540 [Mongoliitalea lutea]